MIFENLFPNRVSYGRGAGYTFDPLTGLLTVDTSKRDRRYRVVAIPHGWRVTKDAGTPGSDPTEDHYCVERDGYRCCCRGHQRWGYCIHSDAVADLDAAGYLEHGECIPELLPPVSEAEIDDMALRAAAAFELAAERWGGESEILEECER